MSAVARPRAMTEEGSRVFVGQMRRRMWMRMVCWGQTSLAAMMMMLLLFAVAVTESVLESVPAGLVDRGGSWCRSVSLLLRSAEPAKLAGALGDWLLALQLSPKIASERPWRGLDASPGQSAGASIEEAQTRRVGGLLVT